MKNSSSSAEAMAANLRAAAEKTFDAPAAAHPGLSSDELMHELRVHQIELEMQNLSLRQAHLVIEESRDQYFDLYEFAPVGYITVTAMGLIEKVNLTAASLLGTERATLQNSRFGSLVVLEDQPIWNAYFFSAIHRPERQSTKGSLTLRLKRSDGSVFYASIDSTNSRGDEPITLRLAVSDVTERIRAEEELRISAIAFESQQGMFLTDPNGIIQRVNGAFVAITGFDASEAVGRTSKLLNSGHHDKAFFQAIFAEIAKRDCWGGEIWNRTKSGDIRPMYMTISAVRRPDGEIAHYVAAFLDITRDKAADAEIHRLAFYDALTQLPNRRLLRDELSAAIGASSRSGQHGAVIFMDLDNFKTLNDTRGHDIGDELLIEVAARVKKCIGARDTVARFGGDEFVVILRELGVDSIEASMRIRHIGETIRKTIAEPYDLGGVDFRCTASLGVSQFNRQQASIDILLKQADLAMYEAKSAGRNVMQFFNPAMQAALEQRLALEADLRFAIEKNQLLLHYQPQVDHSGKVVGAEALIRWMHPERGLVSPAEFIPFAEEKGQIRQIGRWVIETACRQIRSWSERPATCDLKLAINISPHQFRQPDFAATVQTILEETHADPHRLKIELTEGVVMGNVEETIASMMTLQAIGVEFSLDDFGTGYSSLSYLKRLPIQQLKIDRGFVRDLSTDPNDAAIVRTIITMGKTLGLEVIAEGVETQAQRERLLEYGCHMYQGYLYSPALPIDEFESFCERTSLTGTPLRNAASRESATGM